MKIDITKAGLEIKNIVNGDSTTFAIMSVLELAENKHGKSVGFFSLKESSESIALRIIAFKSKVPSSKLATGKISPDDFTKVSDCMGKINSLPIYIDDTPSLTISALQDKAKKLMTQGNLGVVIIDNFQLMHGSAQEVLGGLNALTEELHIPIIAFSGMAANE